MSDDATPRLGLPYVAAGQAQKHVTVNEGLARLDGLVQTAVVSRTTAAQPVDPDDGALYLLPEDATGDVWASEEAGALMRFEAGGWRRLQPRDGHLVWVTDESIALVLDGGWQTLSSRMAFESLIAATSPSGARVRVAIREADAAPVGAVFDTALTIPARSIVLGVAARTLTTITGATAFDCGLAGDTSKFGGSLGVTAGSTNIGVIGPTAFYTDTAVRLTALGGDFTGGLVRLSLFLVQFDAPEA